MCVGGEPLAVQAFVAPPPRLLHGEHHAEIKGAFEGGHRSGEAKVRADDSLR